MAAVQYPEKFQTRSRVEKNRDSITISLLVWANGDGLRARIANRLIAGQSGGWNLLEDRFNPIKYRENFDRFATDGVNTKNLFGEPVIGQFALADYVLKTGLAGPRFQQSHYVDTRGDIEPEVFDILINTLLGLDGSDHKELRRFVSREFLERAVSEISDVLEQRADSLIDTWVEEARKTGGLASRDIVSEIAGPYSTITIMELLGYPSDSVAQLERLGNAAIGFIDPTAPFDQNELNEAMNEFTATIRQIKIAAKANSTDINQDALIPRLVRDGLEGLPLLSMATVLLVAGYITTKSHMSETVCTLANNRGKLNKFEDAIVAGNNETVEEILITELRVNPPIRLLGRDIPEHSPVTLPDGTEYSGPVVIDILASNMDTDRPKGKDISFGSGVHRCVGAPLASLETRVLVTKIVERLRLKGAEITGRTPSPLTPHPTEAIVTFTVREEPLVVNPTSKQPELTVEAEALPDQPDIPNSFARGFPVSGESVSPDLEHPPQVDPSILEGRPPGQTPPLSP